MTQCDMKLRLQCFCSSHDLPEVYSNVFKAIFVSCVSTQNSKYSFISLCHTPRYIVAKHLNAQTIKGVDIGRLKISWIGFIGLVGILSMWWFSAFLGFQFLVFSFVFDRTQVFNLGFSQIKFCSRGFQSQREGLS